MRSDEELMARMAAGDWDALEILLARVEMPLFAFLHRLGARPDIVQDLAQEVMIRLYEHRHRYEPERPFRPWLFGIAVNVWKDSRRRRARENAGRERLWLGPEDEVPAPDPRQRDPHPGAVTSHSPRSRAWPPSPIYDIPWSRRDAE